MTAQPPACPMPDIVGLERSEFGGDTFWSVALDGGHSVCVTTEELRANKKFICNCMEQIGQAFEPTTAKRWAAIVNEALQGERERRQTQERG